VAARTVKAGNDAALFVPSDRILRLIAVMLSRRRTRNTEQLCAVLTANARQRITHLFLLCTQFFPVGDVLITAAAALVRHRTCRRNALSRRHDNLLYPAERHIFRHLDNADITLIANCCARHKYRPAFDLRKPRAVRRVIRNLTTIRLILLQIHKNSSIMEN